MNAGAGPETRVSVAPPAQPLRSDGAILTSAELPLLATVISTVMFWPFITLEGVRLNEAVKSPMNTEFELARALAAAPVDALAVK